METRVAGVCLLGVGSNASGVRIAGVEEFAFEDRDEVRSESRADPLAVFRSVGSAERFSVIKRVVRLVGVANLARLDPGSLGVGAERADPFKAAASSVGPRDAREASNLAIAAFREAGGRLQRVETTRGVWE